MCGRFAQAQTREEYLLPGTTSRLEQKFFCLMNVARTNPLKHLGHTA